MHWDLQTNGERCSEVSSFKNGTSTQSLYEDTEESVEKIKIQKKVSEVPRQESLRSEMQVGKEMGSDIAHTATE